MMGFAEFQAAFQRALLNGDTAVLADIVDSPRETAGRLLSVYQSAYRLRLMEFVNNDFSVLRGYAGEAAFAQIARGYAGVTVSTNPNARWYGAGMAKFLAATEPWSAQSELAEVAALEWALADVFDAADDRRLVLDDLAVLEPEDWPGVSFSPHAATRRLNLKTNARELWRAVSREEPLPEPRPLAEPDRLLIYRPELTAMLRPMSYEEAMMWDEMAKEVNFGVLCEMVAMYGGEDEAAARAAGYLKLWITSGLLAGPAD